MNIIRHLLLKISFLIVILTNATELEDHLETQIDNREPRGFHQFVTHTLSVRQEGFKFLTITSPDGKQSRVDIGNWELFATRYYYETRIQNANCEMIPHGIAATADWALMVPCLFGDMSKPPNTIFVHNYMLSHFVESTLRFMNSSYRFVLISAGTDMTIPRSIDPRFHPLRGFGGGEGGELYHELLGHSNLIHWFCENHDLNHPKLSTLPTGMEFTTDDRRDDFPDPATIKPIQERALKVLVSDRVRTGRGTWALRAEVVHMCGSSPICFRPENINADIGVPRKEYLQLLASVPFVACVRGGGIDPSPKAWEALLLGTIPIIQHSTLDDGYKRFPVVFINDWSEIFENENATVFLQQKLIELAPFYEENSDLRKKTLEKLTTNYWVEQFYHKVQEYHDKRAKARHFKFIDDETNSSRRYLRSANRTLLT